MKRIAVLMALVSLRAAVALADFELREPIGRHWSNERVVFPLTPAQAEHASQGHGLNGPDGRPVAYQLVADTNAAAGGIAFLVDLPPYAVQAYSFDAARTAMPETGLNVRDTDSAILMVNGLTGIEIRKIRQGDQGPLARIRLPSGAWVGDSRLRSDVAVASYTAELGAQGPVFAEVVCRVVFEDHATWELRIRLDAGEPVMTIEERSTVESDRTVFQLDLKRDFNPTHVFHRRSWQDGFRFVLAPLTTGRVFLLQPWQNWFESQTQGASFSLARIAADGSDDRSHPDVLTVGAGWAGRWIDPEMPAPQRQPAHAPLTLDAQSGLHLEFQLKHGQRHWMIGGLQAETALAKSGDGYPTTPLPYQVVIKHGQFPLDRVKDQILAWEQPADRHPGMLLAREDIERFRARLDEEQLACYRQQIPRIVKRKIDRYYLDEPIEAWCASGDERLARHLIEGAEYHMQEALGAFLVQKVPYGSAPHMTTWLGTAMSLADIAIGTGLMPPEQSQRMLARAAFIAYAIDRPDYWCTQRGYAGLPNMTTSVYGYLASAASLVARHPNARDWAWRALGELRRQVRSWSDENGGWLEAPHYAVVSYDAILGALAMAANAGLGDWLYTEPRVRAVANWLGKISTPPDSRINGIRHLPHVGHTYLFEPTSTFGTMAYLFRDKDPEFASQMQWMWQAQGAFGRPGIASAYATMAGYRTVMLDPAIPAAPPEWSSEWFPETGVMLRSGFPDPRETQLYLIAGSHRSHYDDDSGAFTLWGKGRIVADMFGYCGASPAHDHSLVESPARAGVMQIETFETDDAFDYVSGLAGGWRRQILFLKDADPLGPNYFVIGDSFDRTVSPTWRLWLTAEDVRLDRRTLREEGFQPETAQTRHARAIGREDVDTDIFFAQSSTPALSTHTLTKTAGSGLYPNLSQRAMSSTQIGLVARESEALLTVLYPRLKTEAQPEFSILADGRGVKVIHAAGEDYIFMSPSRIEFKQDAVSFEGTVGAVMLRADRILLSLGAAGTISARDRHLKKP